MEKPSGISATRFARVDLDPALRMRRTTSDYIADALRVAIFDGQFADGEELNQVELANYFNVSRAPIREAIRRLQAEGLVSSEAHRRAFVIGLELGEIIELIELRALIEGYLVEKAGPHLETVSLQKLESLCDEMETLKTYDYDWVRKNWEFHQTLYLPSGLETAIGLVERYHQKVERYIRRTGNIERQRRAAVEHRNILKYVERRDFSSARIQVQEHIIHTGDEIRRHYGTVEES